MCFSAHEGGQLKDNTKNIENLKNVDHYDTFDDYSQQKIEKINPFESHSISPKSTIKRHLFSKIIGEDDKINLCAQDFDTENSQEITIIEDDSIILDNFDRESQMVKCQLLVQSFFAP